MNRLMSCIPLVLFFLSAQAAEPSLGQIETQQNDQELCVQQRVKNCIDVCEKSDDDNCKQICEQNAKNECRQAGE
ncbi:hypothetical protein [Legionella brunensis]|uniref:Uncharacterized protein n=1 Tax=Legionella brunensis TaxID=29422 RepID=A0A0W0ST65_9GAMM|nr:hypothetical protein [Legionella brunensis]KTC86444.1 hypothetical protein Lbru_0385 [Legionella brunensis]